MVYNSRIHHRKSIRLKEYDYSQEGMYFITICVQNKKMLFGKITRPVPVGADPRVCPDNDPSIPPINSNPQLTLNDAGEMIEKWFMKLETKFPDIECDIFIVMPNHVHCIIVNNGAGNSNIARANWIKKGFNLDKPSLDRPLINGETSILGKSQNLGESKILDDSKNLGESSILGEHVGSPLGSVMQWFKTMSTNEYIRGVKTLDWERFDGKLWQRNYWEHIIRDERSYNAIKKYIINNPQNWDVDKMK